MFIDTIIKFIHSICMPAYSSHMPKTMIVSMQHAFEIHAKDLWHNILHKTYPGVLLYWLLTYSTNQMQNQNQSWPLGTGMCICLEFWLVHCVVYVCCGWPLWLLWYLGSETTCFRVLAFPTSTVSLSLLYIVVLYLSINQQMLSGRYI